MSLETSRSFLETAKELAAEKKAERKEKLRKKTQPATVYVLPSVDKPPLVTVEVVRLVQLSQNDAEHYCEILNKLDDVSAVIVD